MGLPDCFPEVGQCVLVDGGKLRRMRHQELAKAIPLPPTFERLNAVFRSNRLAIVPPYAIPQSEYVSHAIRRDAGSLNHLRLDLLVRISPEKRIVDEIAA
jgi:hypothetical protein